MFENWAHVSVMRLNKVKVKQGSAFGLSQSQICIQTGRRTRQKQPCKIGLNNPVDKKPDMNQQIAFAAQVTNWLPGCIQRGVVSRVREEIALLYYAFMKSHLEYFVKACKERYRAVKVSPEEAMGIFKGLQNLLYEKKLRVLDLFNLEKGKL